MENTNESEQKVEAKNEEIQAETSNANSDDRDVLKQSDRIIAEMRKENDRKQKLLDREEKLLARQETLRALGGGSPAGQTPEKPKEETPKEYADRVMKNKT